MLVSYCLRLRLVRKRRLARSPSLHIRVERCEPIKMKEKKWRWGSRAPKFGNSKFCVKIIYLLSIIYTYVLLFLLFNGHQYKINGNADLEVLMLVGKGKECSLILWIPFTLKSLPTFKIAKSASCTLFFIIHNSAAIQVTIYLQYFTFSQAKFKVLNC